MGFYGNITNTSNTTFQFDKIYPNRRAMESNVNNDGIFIGRYVLVEYDQDAAYPNVFLKDGQYYSSPNTEDLTRVRFLSGERYNYIPTTDEYPIKGKQYYIKIEDGVFEPVDIKTNTKFEDLETTYYEKIESIDGVYKEEVVQVQEIRTDDKGHTTYINIGFYECDGFVTENSINYATFKKITKDPTAKSNYIQNFAIDEKHQDAEQQKSFKGYDSTVWVKSSITTNDGKLITKYVNIADLNSVVPTFDIAADAPTMVPITPHFDADSTNVYYKLHMQTPFGFRIKENTQQSDQTTTHYETVYDKNGNITSQNKRENVKADIFYNKNALEYKPNNNTNRVITEPRGLDEIKLTVGKSIDYDTKYQHYTEGDVQGDIQELSIHLPSVGYMVSQGWDVIHGENRDDARTDNNDSLKGRLDSFKEIKTNQIPVKRANDGTLVGSKINNAIQYQLPNGKDILSADNIPNKFKGDDPWIETEIDTTDLVGGTKAGESNGVYDQTNNSGISIRHTFHGVKNSQTTLDKNSGEFLDKSNSNTELLQKNKLPVTNEDTKNDNTIKLYTPYVDATGHVVGKNIETITLPYGYKTFTTNGLVNETDADLDASTGRKTVANNTQDTLAINTKNKWLQVEITNDKIELAHEIHGTTNSTNTTDWTQTEANTTIPTTTYEFDNAGHYVSHHTENYKLPFGYGKIVGDSGSTEATATFDELIISANDNWIATTVSDDQVNITHTGPVVISVPDQSNIVNPNFGSTFIIEDWYFDAKGHKHTGKSHTVQFPKGSLNDLTATGSSVLTGISMIDETGDITQQNANVGTLTLAEYTQGQSGGLKISDTNTINGAFKGIQDYINTLDMSNTSNTQFITKITQTDGQVAVERAAAGTLQLGTASTDGTIPATSSLNNAFNITNARIKKEEDALAKEIQDRKDAIDALTGTKDYSEHFDTMKEIADWLDANKDGVVDITLNVTANAKAISDEAALARSEEGKLAQAIEGEALRAQDVETDLQDQIDSLGTAAWSQAEDFATAAQGSTADATAATIATYGDIVFYNAEDVVSKEEYNALLSDYNDLKELVEKLNNQINPPQEPDEGGETV